MRTPDFFYHKDNLRAKIFSLFYPVSIMYMLIFTAIFLTKKYLFFFKPKTRVICIGNLVLGGSGKTEIAMLIARKLGVLGIKFCFLTRGYGRSEKSDIFLQKNQEILQNDFERFGDEPILLSQLGDVFITKNRKNFLISDKSSEYEYIIMDDGLSDSRFKKDFTFLLFDADFLDGNGKFLPIGPVRIPYFLLKHSIDALIFTNKTGESLGYKRICKKIYCDDILFSEIKPIETDKNKSYIAFSGLGLNSKFFNTLKKNGVKIANTVEFEDHVKYSTNDIGLIISEKNKFNCDGIITTSKDFLKLPDDFKKMVTEYKISHEIKDFDIFLQKSLQIKK